MGDEHRHAGAVLAGVEHLLGDIGRGLTRDLRFAPGADRLRADVETQHAARGEVVGVGEESLGVLAVAAEAADGAETGRGHLAERRAVAVEDPRDAARVLHIGGDDLAADEVRAVERDVLLRDELAPARGRRVLEIDRDDAAARCGVRRLHIGRVAFTTDDVVARVPRAEQAPRLRSRIAQVDHIDTVGTVAVEQRHEEPTPIVRHRRTGHATRMVGDLVDRAVGGLRRTRLVEVHHRLRLIIAATGVVGARRIAAVVDTRAVRRPGEAPELGLAQLIR